MEAAAESKLNQQIPCSYKSFAASQNYKDVSNLPKEVSLKQLVSGSQESPDQSLSNLKETHEDCCSKASLMPVYAGSITFAFGMTIALIMHIYPGQSLVPVKGVLVSDHKLCTALGQRVLHDHGSSVDAAIAATLCLSVVYPHVSGVGGGGVMLVHDIQKNKTRVIDYQTTEPKRLKEEMLLDFPHLKAGLEVGVPGMLRGLHQAHSLYGSLSWEDVVSRPATVAEEGFNVSHSLAEAIEQVKGKKLSKHFQDIFFPNGLALQSGSLLRIPGLVGVLQAPLLDFYDGNFSQEIEEEVRANGGVLSREDTSSYTVQVEQPVETLLNDSIIQVPPGAALISDLSLLQGYHHNENNTTESQEHHWNAETQVAGQVVVMGPDDFMVSVSRWCCYQRRSDVNCGYVCAILNFSWPRKTQGQHLTNQRNRFHPGKRTSSSLAPTIVVPAWSKCGIYMAFGSRNEQQSLSIITQVMSSAIMFPKEKNETFTRRRNSQLESDRALIDSEFPGESAQLQGDGHGTQIVKTNSEVCEIMRKKDIIMAIMLPRLSDNS
ncbi:glutathione hydrolase 7-like isoform X1 [Cheilinus undulatus]|uniref:glutathione hydrolase 7-like isoform X1 n=1 Tax=Cheilinus undulatus TaxID=241271 RepID=UPI001BD3D109|nr:glutathione hydrolase 7-like isoform X1 [Cheilinus undulatus]